MDTPIDEQARRFYDGGTATTPPVPDRPPLIVLSCEFGPHRMETTDSSAVPDAK